MPAARAHLRYIQRDGVIREGAPGGLYSSERDTADGKAFLSAVMATTTSFASSSRRRWLGVSRPQARYPPPDDADGGWRRGRARGGRSWTIRPDFVYRAAAYEARRHQDQPFEVEAPRCDYWTRYVRPTRQPGSIESWHRNLRCRSVTPPLARRPWGQPGRQQWLVEQQLADLDGDRIRLRANVIVVL